MVQFEGSVASEIKAVVFKVSGETNTDDLSPAQDAWSRPDIPLHAKAMYKMQREGLQPEEPGVIGPMGQIKAIKERGLPVAYVGDVVEQAHRESRRLIRCCGFWRRNRWCSE